MGDASQRDVIRYRVCSKLLRQDGQVRMQNLPETPSAQESLPSDRPPTASQHDAMLQLAVIFNGLRRLDTGPILPSGDWPGKLRRRTWDLGRRSLRDTGVFRQRNA